MSANPPAPPTALIWVDLEMTGLDPDADHVLELAIAITDRQLELVCEPRSWVFSCAEEVLAGMDKWNTSTHAGNGLVDDVRASDLDYATGESEALEYVSEHVEEGKSPMCGSTICQDRRFLYRRLRRFHDHFHYRNLDVTSFKLAVAYWSTHEVPDSSKNSDHRALGDILGSIEDMRYYRNILFKG